MTRLKVNAVLNEIAGKNHLGTRKTKVPTIIGMNFQAVSVGQKLVEKSNRAKGGYLDAAGTPTTALLDESSSSTHRLSHGSKSSRRKAYTIQR